MHVDIVGGSFGGLSTAISLKRLDKNIDVTVYEKHNQIGYNPEGRRCAEGYIYYPDLANWRPPEDCVFNHIQHIDFTIGSTKYLLPISPQATSLMIVNRQKFLAHIGKIAMGLGVDVRTHEKIASASGLDGTYIVDASGCPSIIRKELGLPQRRTAKSFQQTLENSNRFSTGTASVFFKDSVGYYWIFPRDASKKEINLGVGVLDFSAGSPKDLLLSFKEQEGIQGDVNHVTGGLIPIGIQKPLRQDNILFVGDAGVGTFSITGEGVPRAILSGEVAARCIVTGNLHRYPVMMTREFFRWDLIGKSSVTLGNVLQRIGPDAYAKILNWFFRYFFFPSFY